VGQSVLVPMEKVKINDPRNQKNYFTSKTQQREPIFHHVKPKETLFSIAKQYKVGTAEIKKWNSMKSASLKKNSSIIVGYKTKEVIPVSETTKVETTPVVKPPVKSDSLKMVATPDSVHLPMPGFAANRKSI